MKILGRIAVPLLSLWLIVWILLSWGAIQDDALIHLRYADFLHRVHFITYDGIHRSYGTSSLMYVSLLAFLRNFTTSPLLSRGVSTFAHICLFVAMAALVVRATRTASARVMLLAVSLLLLLVVPSAVRWLDDGMETGIVMGLAGLAVWWAHKLSLRSSVSPAGFAVAMALGFLLVFLRSELGIVALFASGVVCLAAAGEPDTRWPVRALRAAPAKAHFLLGALLAAVCIRVVMGSFLPDTARAKSHGIAQFVPSLMTGGHVIVSALTFGLGSLVLWLLSVVIVLTQPRVRALPTLLANLLFPVVLLASALRGQEIQGVRYLIWTLFFSILWNLFELWHIDATTPVATAVAPRSLATVALTGFLVCCVLALPIDSHYMHRLMADRAHTMRLFMSEDLATALHGELGVASDVGYISYFSNDPICDIAGLVNGPAAALLTPQQRAARCARENPAFLFMSSGQAGGFQHDLDIADWRVCGVYDFGNVFAPDRHYLIVKPDLAPTVCHATGYISAPLSQALVESAYP